MHEMGKMLVDGLPKKPAGDVKVDLTIEIKEDFSCHLTAKLGGETIKTGTLQTLDDRYTKEEQQEMR